MKDEHYIENLFKHARLPELRPRLKEKVLSAAALPARQPAGARRPILRLAFACAVAACILVAFIFALLARTREKEIFAKLHDPPSVATETDTLYAEFGLRRPIAARPHFRQADLLARKAILEKLLKGDYNGS